MQHPRFHRIPPLRVLVCRTAHQTTVYINFIRIHHGSQTEHTVLCRHFLCHRKMPCQPDTATESPVAGVPEKEGNVYPGRIVPVFCFLFLPPAFFVLIPGFFLPPVFFVLIPGFFLHPRTLYAGIFFLQPAVPFRRALLILFFLLFPPVILCVAFCFRQAVIILL